MAVGAPAVSPPLFDSRLAAPALLILFVLCRLAVWTHPRPVHGDEDRFVAGIAWLQAAIDGSAASQARGMAAYPVQAPGYPLWIGLGWLLSRAGLAPYTAFQTLTFAASLLDVLLMHRLARRMLSPHLALALALLYGLTPIHWFHSVTALNYSAGSCLASGIALLAWRGGGSAIAAAWLCVAGASIRPDLLLWLGPLCIWVASCEHARRRTAAVVAVLMLGLLVWVGIVAALYAVGAAEQSSQSLEHTIGNVLGSSVLLRGLRDGLLRNSVKLAAVIGWGLGVATAIGFGLAAIAALRSRLRAGPRARFLIVWLMPAVAFNALIHMTEPGHALWHVAPLLLMLGAMLECAAPHRAVRIVTLLALLAAGQFWFYPWSGQWGTSEVKRLIDAKTAYVSRIGLLHIDLRRTIHQPGDFWPTDAHNPRN